MLLHYTVSGWEEVLRETRAELPDAASELAQRFFGYRLWLQDESPDAVSPQQLEYLERLAALYDWVGRNGIHPLVISPTLTFGPNAGRRWIAPNPGVGEVQHPFAIGAHNQLPGWLFRRLPDSPGGYREGDYPSLDVPVPFPTWYNPNIAVRIWTATYVDAWAPLEWAAHAHDNYAENGDLAKRLADPCWQKEKKS